MSVYVSIDMRRPALGELRGSDSLRLGMLEERASVTPSFGGQDEDPDPGDVNDARAPAGMVLRYCHILGSFYWADPQDGWCHCGHRLGDG
jgi:hypothetical protein